MTIKKAPFKWVLNLKLGASEKVKHSFCIKYPKEKPIHL
jgi:hypothetical protein